MQVQGTEVITAESMRARVPFIPLPEGAGQALRCDSFTIDYRPDGSVAQFRSVISRRDVAGSGGDLGSKEIYVNEPLRFGGVTAYQVCSCRAGQLYCAFPEADQESTGDRGHAH